MTIPTDTRKMKYFDEWAKDKKPLLATIALIIASSVEDCYELFGAVKEGTRIEGDVSLPHLKNWLKMYQNPQKVVIGLFSALSNHDSHLAGILYFYRMLLKFDKMSPAEMREIWNQIQSMTAEEKNEIKEDVNSLLKTYQQMAVQVVNYDGETAKGPDDGKKKQLDELPQKSAVIFFLRVLFPCLNIYGMYPRELLGRARQGDIDALEKLIRLDKSAIFDQKISEIVHQAQAEKTPGKMSRIKEAFRSSPKIYMTRTKIKYLLGGLISLMSEAMRNKITATEIDRLFNAIALDMGKGGVQPGAVMTTEEFQKAIQRYRVLWKPILQLADKK